MLRKIIFYDIFRDILMFSENFNCLLVLQICRFCRFADSGQYFADFADFADSKHRPAGCNFPKNSERTVLFGKYHSLFHYPVGKVCRSHF